MFDTELYEFDAEIADHNVVGAQALYRSEVDRVGRSSPSVRTTGNRPATLVSPDQPSISLNDLLVRVSHQDQAAFRSVFDHFAPRLKAFLMGQGTGAQMAEEVVQETMVKIWRKANQYDPTRAAASTWIFTIARNMRIDHLRKNNRPEPDMDDPAFVPDPEPLATETISQAQDAAELHAAMAELSEEQRAVLKLAYFEEKAHPEIAEALDIPLGTVKSRIRLALKNIRSKIGDNQ